MDKYVTVVSVDDQLQMASVVGVAGSAANAPVVVVGSNGMHDSDAGAKSDGTAACSEQRDGGSSPAPNSGAQSQRPEQQEDSQFVTVLSINHGGDGSRRGVRQNAPEVVLVYRLPGERLGFGLKFQGGTKSNEKIHRLFIQSCAENSPASRVQASWGHLREGDEILEIDGVSVTRMTRIECVKCLKDSNVAIKLLVRNGEGKVQNFYGDGPVAGNGVTSGNGAGVGAGGGSGGGELPERKGAPPPPPPVPPRKLNKRKQSPADQQQPNGGGSEGGPPSKQGAPPPACAPPEPFGPPPPDPETYSNLFAADDISDLISESDDTASTISTVVDKFSICSSLSSEDYTIPSNGPSGIGQSLELAKALKPFTLLEQEFNLESKFETTNLFTFKPPPPLTNVVQLEVPAAVAEKPPQAAPVAGAAAGGEYENVTIMKVDENRNYENVSVPYGGPYENVTIQTVQPYENMVLHRGSMGAAGAVSGRRVSVDASLDSGGVYENVDLKAASVPPRPLPRQAAAVVEPKKRAPIPVPIPIVVPPPRLKPTKQVNGGGGPQSQSQPAVTVVAASSTASTTPPMAPLGSEYSNIQNWLQEATEVIHECALVTNASAEGGSDVLPTEEKVDSSSVKETTPASQPQSGQATGADLPRLIDFHPKVSQPMEGLEEVEAVAPPASPTMGVRYEGPPALHHPEDAEDDGQYDLPAPEAIVRKCIRIISSGDHTYIESSSSDDDDDDEKMYGRGRSEDEDDRSSVLSREATTPEQFLSGDGYSDEDGEKLGPPEIVSGGPSEAYFNFPWTSNLLPPIGEVEEEFSSLEHQHNGPIVIIDTADETVINDTNNNQQRERKKPLDDECPKLPQSAIPSSKIVTKTSNRVEVMSAVQGLANGNEKKSASSGAECDQMSAPVASVDARDVSVDHDAAGDRDQLDSNGCFTPDSLDEAYDEQPEAGEQSQEPEEPMQSRATVAEECVNSTAATDNADEISMENPSTCEEEIVSGGANGGSIVESVHRADGGTPVLDEQEKEPSSQLPDTPASDRSATMEDGNESANERSSASDKALPSEANPVKITAKAEKRVEEDDSNIDAICGDVDIVVGDTVESDFEELVKAQIEPLDTEDSSEQIQQIHERIIVGIERAVSDEGDEGEVLSVGDGAMTDIVGVESDTGGTSEGGADVIGADKATPEATIVEPVVASGASIEVTPESLTPVEDQFVEVPQHNVQRQQLVEEQEEKEDTTLQPENDPVEQAAPAAAARSIVASPLGGGTESVESSAGNKPLLAGSHTETAEAKPSAPGSVTSMDSMNNVVTTTTTVTAIASTVHQLIPAPSAAAAAAAASTAAAAAAATAANGGKVAPPAFSRLPPDGHEFPPNFTEPSAATTPTSATASTTTNGSSVATPPPTVAAMAIMNGGVTAPVLAKSNDKHSSFNDDLPELPKSHPPPVPRKVLRSDLTPKGNANGQPSELDGAFRKPPPAFSTRSSSVAESMMTRKELPQAYQSLQSVFEQRRRSVDVPDHHQQQHAGKPPAAPGRITLVGSNWRKDEKSERSVRDKIAMFSSAAAADGDGAAVPTPGPIGGGVLRKFSKDFTKSSENLLGGGGGGGSSKKPTVEAIETYATLRKKAHSVEHLDEVDKSGPLLLSSSDGRGESASSAGAAYKAKFSLETSKPVVLGKAYSVENLNPLQRGAADAGKTTSGGQGALGLGVDGSKILSRTTSFSGYSNGNSLATIASPSASANNSATDERWKSSISNLLEQRKKSMSKLRGLVIPEKVPEAEVLADSRIIGLPIIKSKDSEIILSSGVPTAKGTTDGGAVALSYSRKTSTLPTPAKSSVHSLASPSPRSSAPIAAHEERSYKGVSRAQTSLALLSGGSSDGGKLSESESEITFRKPLPPLPPAKPPRTSLVYPPKSGSSDCLRSTEDESDDSDSVLSSRVSSPPVSPVAPAAPVEKYALTRTLSSETNTSITSSNSTLTSSSGSQASCSSVGSTPTVDISRKLSKSSSSEASMNRKNVLASAKCRSGRGDLKIEDVGYGGVVVGAGKPGRYEDGDSTDGYEEEERRKSKSKPRSSLTNSSNNNSASQGYEPEKKEPTHYKVVDKADSIVDKVIKVASYVEVVSDLEDGSSIAEDATDHHHQHHHVVMVAATKPLVVAEKPIAPQEQQSPKMASAPMSDLAKWVRHEAARSISHKESTGATELTTNGAGPATRPEKKTVSPPSMMSRTISEPAPRTPAPVPVKRELRSSVETKKLNLAEIRKSFESKSANSTVIPTPVKQTARETHVAPPSSTPVAAVVASTVTPSATNNSTVHATPKSHATTNGHDRFSSWDSLASSSSGVSSLQTNSLGLGQAGSGNPNCSGSSQTLQSTPSDYGSFSSLGSSHSLITPQDLQLIIEEADPPLATPEAFVVVLQRETPESSIGITLAGGSDYEAKEITIHKILTNSPADRDGRLRKGDRILSINGLSMRGLTHRESLSVLKTPRPEVVMVITRSKSLVLDTLTKLKRPSMGSLSSLAEKSELTSSEYERKLKIQHKASRSLDLDHLDVASNEAESVFDGTASEDGLLSADDVSKCSSSNPNDSAPSYAVDVPEGCRMVEINKDGAGLGFSIEGGFDSPTGNKPLIIKKIFMGGAAEKSGLLRAGEEIVAINDASIAKMTRIQVWNMMKKLPNGSVRITLK